MGMTSEIFETIKAIIACVSCTLIGYIGGYLMRHLKGQFVKDYSKGQVKYDETV